MQDMGFNDKLPEYLACYNFLDAIKPNPKGKAIDVVILICQINSPYTDSQSNQRDVFFVMDTQNQKITSNNAKETGYPSEEHAKIQEVDEEKKTQKETEGNNTTQLSVKE